MAKRERHGQYGGDQDATAIILKGSVELKSINDAIDQLEQYEQNIATKISVLTVNNASKKEIEVQRVRFIQAGAAIEALIEIAGGRSMYSKIIKLGS